MSDAKNVSTVLSASQSPMNAKQWLCSLSCGHELWQTKSSRPKGKIHCGLCKFAEMKREGKLP